MPSLPITQNLKSDVTSRDVVNAIRKEATDEYQKAIPVLDDNIVTLNTIGKILGTNDHLANEFLHSLVNRIAYTLVTSKMFNNPWAMFKRGFMELGESVEEVFVKIAQPFDFDPERAVQTQFKREIPDVLSAFHRMNYTKFYKTTIDNDMLKTAFLSWDGVMDLISRITDSLYAGAEYDEFLMLKYMIASQLVKGGINPTTIPTVQTATMKEIVGIIKGTSNFIEFPVTDYNIAGVENFTKKSDQFIIINSKFDAVMDVEVLASAFNMSRAEFMGNRVLVDSFGKFDMKRLKKLIGRDKYFVEFTQEQLTALDNVPAVLLDREWFMVFDNLFKFTEKYNGEGLSWNYWLHVWKTFSVSPFANATAFITGTPTITSITLSPDNTTATPDSFVQISATIDAQDFAFHGLEWETDSDYAEVSYSGLVYIKPNATGTITVTATSVYDNSVTASVTITIDNA